MEKMTLGRATFLLMIALQLIAVSSALADWWETDQSDSFELSYGVMQ
jgi:hypothetical protein